MQNTISSILLMTFSLFMVVFFVEASLYGVQLVKAHNFATHAVEIAEKNGGFEYSYNGKNVDLIPQIRSEMKDQKMSGWKFDYTKGRVDYNGDLYFSIYTDHTFYIFQLLGINALKVPVYSHREGTGQVYFRN